MKQRVRIKPHAGQNTILRRRNRFNVICCGRRFGKTLLAWLLVAESVCKGHRALYTCPTAEDYSKRWDEAQRFFNPIITAAHVSDGVFEFVGGGRCDFAGLHRYDGIRGNKYHRAINDEAAHAVNLRAAWTEVIRATLADYKGDAYFLSTPKGDNYFKELFYKADENWISHQMPTARNRHIDAAEIEAARLELPSVVFAQEFLAEFVTLQGNRIRREWLKYAEPPEHSVYAVGVDLAISTKSEADFTAMVVTAKSGNYYYVCDVLRMKTTFNSVLETIKSIAAKWKPTVISIEATQYQAAMIQELVRTTTLPIKAVYPSKDKVTRFIPVEGKYEHGYIYHSTHLPREFEDELLSFPNSKHDDTVDALVHSITSHEQTSFAFMV